MKTKSHVSEKKKEIVKELSNLLHKRSILVCTIKNLKDAQFQEIKKKLRDKAIVKVVKKSLIDIALEQTKKEEFKELIPYIQSDYALVFSDEDAFKLSLILSENKTPVKARAGQEAVEDIWVRAGPTNLPPGPDISALSSVGLQPKVEGGKIAIAKDTLFVKKGEKISEEKSAILAKLDIKPFEIGLEPVVALFEGKLYKEIKIDKKKVIKDLIDAYSKTLAFAVTLNIIEKETLPFILAKASLHEKAILNLIQTKSTGNQ